jgi:hypothetical protein
MYLLYPVFILIFRQKLTQRQLPSGNLLIHVLLQEFNQLIVCICPTFAPALHPSPTSSSPSSSPHYANAKQPNEEVGQFSMITAVSQITAVTTYCAGLSGTMPTIMRSVEEKKRRKMFESLNLVFHHTDTSLYLLSLALALSIHNKIP